MREIRNLILDPHPVSVSHWTRIGGGESDITINIIANNDLPQLEVRNSTDGGGRGVGLLMDLPKGEYVFGLYLHWANAYTPGDQWIEVKQNDVILSDFRYNGYGKYYLTKFNVAQDADTQIILYLPTSSYNARFIARYLSLMTKGDWDTMRNLKNSDGTAANVRWFAPPKTAAAGVVSTPVLDCGEVIDAT